MIGMNVAGIIRGVIFALVFAFLYKGLPGEKVKKGIIYGLIVWLVGAFSGISTMPFYMTIATTVVVYWTIQALIIGIIDGIIVGSIYKEK